MRRTEVVRQIKEIIRQVDPTAEVILFGSEARGDARPDSDIDLLVLLDGDTLSLAREETVTMPLYELELNTGVCISPIVMLKKQWRNRPFKTPFYVNVVNEGVLL
ncbi:MAG TPA: nucleotidyltransferase domain-containing protein [Candidatus Bacteroides pullicola]|uniref:Nucleotidyltransferase domain-containing protein n=1 Tax=Candidatus Bacteroides pullicola TaxID=2838475 RepID=A0A9D2CL67_9BACE|nr:nucleotidyltransferase domain-containing protein [Candidatus Bacteroides pullicola]